MEHKKFNDVIKYLVDSIQKKSISNDQNSYTYRLINQDLKKIIQKVGEEAVEVVIAAGSGNKKQDLINEIADLIFHLLVLIKKKNIAIEEIADELIKRKK